MFNEKIITVDLIPKGNKNRPKYKMNPEYITIHDTGNNDVGANALLHAKFIKNPATSVSWHFTVDDKQIIQHLPIDENGWHAGDGRNGIGNRKSIGIEICMNKDIDRGKAEDLAINLIVYLMKKCSIPIEKVVQHNHWTGKNCPAVIRSRINGWQNFIDSIQDITKNINMDTTKQTIPDWQKTAFKRLVEKGIITTPAYWENRINEQITAGEIFSIINNML